MKMSDFSTSEFYTNPYPTYARLRAEGELVPLAPKIWASGRHATIECILKDRRMGRAYLEGVRLRYGEERAKADVFQTFSRMMLLINPPEHTRIRGLLMRAFNAAQMEKFNAITQEIAEELFDRQASSGGMDVMKDYAIPLSLRIICKLLDVPYRDVAMFSEAVHALAFTFELAPMSDAQITAANAAAHRLEHYFLEILRERRKKPSDDLISLLLLVEENGTRLTDDEIVANIVMLFFAGHETTSHMIGNALIALHRHPTELAKVLRNEYTLYEVVYECLRYDGSVQLTGRAALEDMEIGGTHVAKGDMVYVFLGSANHDPDAFDHAGQLRLAKDVHKPKLLTFGGGIHHCIGARLAWIEIETALKVLIERAPQLEILGIDRLEWHRRNTLRGVESLRVAW